MKQLSYELTWYGNKMSVSEIVLSPSLGSLGGFPHLKSGEFLTNLIGLNVASAQPGGWHIEGDG